MTSINAQQILKVLPLILAAALSLVPVQSRAGMSPREQLLISEQWLAAHLGDEGLVLLHIGPQEDFEAEHIPGAQHVDFNDLAAPHDHAAGDLMLELPEPAHLQRSLRGLGIENDSKIVVYWSSRWVTPATRVVFTLDWVGLGDHTVLLDGGIDAWKAAGNPVGKQTTRQAEGSVTVAPRNLVVDSDWINSHQGDAKYALVDARAPAYFDGISEDTDKKGHIPGAGNLPWTTLLDESVKLKPEKELRALLTKAGVDPGDTVVAYCHIGQFATMAMFAARSLGHEVLLYDGAWQDWAGHDLPVETAP
jgi:thiosulfate/3-mercaptopyruvate sulfurtransferase